MSLSPGTRLGVYEVAAKIGEGGMGEVYQARDTKLDRDVALKVLPEAFTSDPERLARFEREAKVLASLNHPNIAQIHGLEDSGGSQALVLELVEGPTLAERIATGPIPIDEALPIARQIAEALEAAHEAGVIHRDLKPANIKVRDDGTVKVLDFGLAKALAPLSPWGEGRGEGDDLSQSPTVAAAGTREGVILGTAAYMSPEQARGKPLDKRTDIWSFGCVLFEMLTGRAVFGGETLSDTIANVLEHEPQWEALPAGTPPAIGKLLRRCLDKTPRERLHDVADARLEIEEAISAPDAETGEFVAGRPLQVWPRPVPLLVAALTLIGVAGVGVWYATRPEPPRAVRFLLSPDAGESLHIAQQSRDIAISPDGGHIAYLTGTGTGRFGAGRLGAGQLRVRPLGRLASEILVTDGDLNGPFFSPDGAFVGFYEGAGGAGPELKSVSLDGGQMTTICEIPGGVGVTGASWGEDGTIVFGDQISTGGGLWQVAAVGGTPRPLTMPDPDKGELAYRWPEFLPGGEAVLFTIIGSEDSRIAVLEVDTGKQTVVVHDGSFPQFSSTGHLLYSTQGTLWAVEFDPSRLETVGDPVPVEEAVMTKARGAANFDLSDSGTLVYVPADDFEGRQLMWVDAVGEEPLRLPPSDYLGPRMSPDGQRLAVADRTGQGLRGSDLRVFDIQTGRGLLLTQGMRLGGALVWHPEGTRVIFASAEDDLGAVRNVYSVRADGSEGPVLLFDSDQRDYPTSVNLDENVLAFHRVFGEQDQRHREIWELKLDGTEPAVSLLTGPFFRGNARHAPDGKWLAYESNHSGQMEVYVQGYPDPGAVVAISIGGGHAPVWAVDGSSLFYRVDNKMMAVSFAPGNPPRIGSPTLVFEKRYFGVGPAGWPGGERHYDVARGGRFLMMNQEFRNTPATINVALNWTQELLERVPIN